MRCGYVDKIMSTRLPRLTTASLRIQTDTERQEHKSSIKANLAAIPDDRRHSMRSMGLWSGNNASDARAEDKTTATHRPPRCRLIQADDVSRHGPGSPGRPQYPLLPPDDPQSPRPPFSESGGVRIR